MVRQANIEELNEAKKNPPLDVLFASGEVKKAEFVHIEGDSAAGSENGTMRPFRVALRSLSKIVNINYPAGIVPGAFNGLIGGFVIGYIVATIFPSGGDFKGLATFVRLAAAMLLGLVTGAAIGGNTGYKTEYIVK
jgi:hypothetical protein